MWRLWMIQSYFSLRFLSQYSLWKLSIFRGYEGYLYLCAFRMRRVIFSQTELAGDLVSRLNWVASSSRELTKLPVWTFCPMVLQLAWRFSFFACLARVHLLATCKPRGSVASPCYFAQTWAFLHTLSHTTLTWFPLKYRVTNC